MIETYMNDLYFDIMEAYYYDGTDFGYYLVDKELTLAYYENIAHN